MSVELLHMDCMEYMKTLPDKHLDMVVTSPPYDNLRDYGGHQDFSEKLWKEVLLEIFRITKDGGVVCWIVADQTVDGSESGTSFKQALYAKEIGFNLQDTIIWHKGGVRFPDPTRYFDSFEYLFVFSKGRINHFSPVCDRRNKWAGSSVHGTDRQKDGTTKRSSGHNTRDIPEVSRRFNVWEIPNPGIAGNEHPASFPVKIAYDCITTWCPADGIVMDPFLGSGTSAIAANLYGCNFVGTEIDEDYYKTACARFHKETRQISLI